MSFSWVNQGMLYIPQFGPCTSACIIAHPRVSFISYVVEGLVIFQEHAGLVENDKDDPATPRPSLFSLICPNLLNIVVTITNLILQSDKALNMRIITTGHSPSDISANW